MKQRVKCRPFLSLLFFVIISHSLQAGEKVSLLPEIHAVFRGRYEGEWSPYEQRFQVRNARVWLNGRVLPQLDYFLRVDLCDRGKMKFLDAWARWMVDPQFGVKIGQYMLPFGMEAFKAPGTYIFANRSLTGKNIAGVRHVGVTLIYTPRQCPLTIEGGAYNSAPMADHEVWQKELDYAAKATFKHHGLTFAGSFASQKPYVCRYNAIDITALYDSKRWNVGAEYQHVMYSRDRFANTDVWCAYLNYGLPVRWGSFDRWNFNCRYDGMTRWSNGKMEDGVALQTLAGRQRLTAGTSWCCNVAKGVKGEIMLDFEKSFYGKNIAAPVGGGDKVVAELIVRF